MLLLWSYVLPSRGVSHGRLHIIHHFATIVAIDPARRKDRFDFTRSL
jgi:hypothetical protein